MEQSWKRPATTMTAKRIFLGLGLAGVLGMSLLTGGAALADDYPTRPVTLVLPFSAAGAADIGARLFAQGLTEQLGQQVIVENRPGAAANIGYSSVSKAKPDGYEVLIGYIGASACAHSLYPDLTWNNDDFIPVGMFSATPLMIAVHSSVPANTMPELIAYLKEHPGELNYGSPGMGSFVHIGIEAIMHDNGTDMVHVPYNGTGAMLADAMAGVVQLIASGPSTFLGHKGTSDFKLLAVTGTERVADFPDVPSLVELGLKDVNLLSWYGLLLPKSTPQEVVDRLDGALAALSKDEAFVAKAAAAGAPVVYLDQKAFGERIATDTTTCEGVVKAADIKIN